MTCDEFGSARLVRTSVRRVKIAMASAFPLREVFKTAYHRLIAAAPSG